MTADAAGSGPAASAVMGDVIEIARHISLGIQPAPVAACPDEVTVLDMGELNTRYYLRLTAYDKPGALAQISEAFGREGVSVRSMLQDPADHDSATIIFVTHHARESALMKALDAIRGLPVTKSIDTVIRIEEPSS